MEGPLRSRTLACEKTKKTLAAKTAANDQVLALCYTQLVNAVFVANVANVANVADFTDFAAEED